MEDIFASETIIRDYKQSKSPIQFDLYNANRDVVYVNPFAKDFVKNSGSIRIGVSQKEDEDFKSIELMRLQFNIDIFDFLSRPFFLFDKKVNLSSYFSVNQFQSGIIDIPFEAEIEDLNLRIPLKFMEHVCVTFFEGKSKGNKLHEQGSYVVVENTSLESVKVNLIDLFKGINENEKIKITNNDFNKDKTNYELMRVWTNQQSQCEMPILNKSKDSSDKIEPISYLSHMQFQSNIIDIQHKFDLSKIESIETTIMGRTKVMYHLLGYSNNYPKFGELGKSIF